MFWTIVGALLFVFVGIPFIIACLGAIGAQFGELCDDVSAAARWVGRTVQGVVQPRRRRGMGAARRTGRLV